MLQNKHTCLRVRLENPAFKKIYDTLLATGWKLEPMSVKFIGLDEDDPTIGNFQQLNAKAADGSGLGKVETNIYAREDTWAPYMDGVIPHLPEFCQFVGSYLHLMCFVKGKIRHPFCIIETHQGPSNPGEWSIRNLRISSKKVGEDEWVNDPAGYEMVCHNRNEKWLALNAIGVGLIRAPKLPAIPALHPQVAITWVPGGFNGESYYPEHWDISYPQQVDVSINPSGVQVFHTHVYPFEGGEGFKFALNAAVSNAIKALKT